MKSRRGCWGALGLLAILAGCQFIPSGGAPGDDVMEIDAPSSSAIDASELDGPAIDARAIDAAFPIDAAACPAACTSCLPDGTCVITCGNGQCLTGVTCPAGRPCQVTCNGTTACENGIVDCMNATSCHISCVGTDACDAGVRCAGSSCTVTCQGTAACEDGGVLCTATTCSLTCNGTNACDARACCSGQDCGPSCTALAGGCCDCDGCVNNAGPGELW